ncbi:MAG: PepSY domain-containing protein, partial [Rhodospirillaceae bacterium]|nr:PepSY domain-containing protein [Rhodospirillaceae bacterium]
MAWLHSWAGIIAGWLLFAIALTGTLSFFKPEISDWMHPEVRSTNAPIPALVAAVKYLDAHADHTRQWRLLPPDDRTDNGRMFYYAA